MFGYGPTNWQGTRAKQTFGYGPTNWQGHNKRLAMGRPTDKGKTNVWLWADRQGQKNVWLWVDQLIRAKQTFGYGPTNWQGQNKRSAMGRPTDQGKTNVLWADQLTRAKQTFYVPTNWQRQIDNPFVGHYVLSEKRLEFTQCHNIQFCLGQSEDLCFVYR